MGQSIHPKTKDRHAVLRRQALALRTLPNNLAGTLQSAHTLSGVLLAACGEGAQVHPGYPGRLAPPLADQCASLHRRRSHPRCLTLT